MKNLFTFIISLFAVSAMAAAYQQNSYDTQPDSVVKVTIGTQVAASNYQNSAQVATKIGTQVAGSNYASSAQIAMASNQIAAIQNPIITGPIRLFIIGDSKSIITPAAGISNQWSLYFTNLPYWRSNIVFATNCAASGATIVEVTNQFFTHTNLFAPPNSGTNNLIIIRDGANDFPTNSSVPFWINIYSNMLATIQARSNTYSAVWDIQPRTDWPDTKVFNRDAMNQALRRLTNWNYFIKSEDLVPNAFLTDLFVDGIHANTNGALAEANICDWGIRLGPQHFYDEPKSFYERSSLFGSQHTVLSIAAWTFNTTFVNTNGYPITVKLNYQLISAAVAGNVGFSGYVNGVVTSARGINTALAIPAQSGFFGDMIMFVPPFGNYAFTNQTTGAGNSITLFGGQVMIP